jgi:hypothetical protein
VQADRWLAEVEAPRGDRKVLSQRSFYEDVEFMKVDHDEASKGGSVEYLSHYNSGQ